MANPLNKVAEDATEFTLASGTYEVSSVGGTSIDYDNGDGAFKPVPDPNGLLSENAFIWEFIGGRVRCNSGYPVKFKFKSR